MACAYCWKYTTHKAVVLWSALHTCFFSSAFTQPHQAMIVRVLCGVLLHLPCCSQYNLPASYDVLPLMARMTAGLVQHKKNTAVALVSLQWHVPRELKQQAKGRDLTLLH